MQSIVNLIEVGQVFERKQLWVLLPEHQIARDYLGQYWTLAGLPRGQREDRRYDIGDGRSLHEVRYDGYSLFHVDHGRPWTFTGLAEHAIRDTNAPEGAALGGLAALVLGINPVFGLLLGGALGGTRARRRAVARTPEEIRQKQVAVGYLPQLKPAPAPMYRYVLV